MRKRTTRTVIAATTLTLLIMLVGAGVANAAEDSDTHTVTFSNKVSIELDVPETTYGFGDVDPVTGTYTSLDVVHPLVKCNTNWTLYVKGSGAFTSGVNTIPLSRLGWQKNGGSGFTTMTTINASVTTGTRTGASGVSTSMDYQVTITWDDEAADDYTTTIAYTAATP